MMMRNTSYSVASSDAYVAYTKHASQGTVILMSAKLLRVSRGFFFS